MTSTTTSTAAQLVILLVGLSGLAEAATLRPTGQLEAGDRDSLLQARLAGLSRENDVNDAQKELNWRGVIMPTIAAAATVIGALALLLVRDGEPSPWIMAFSLSLAAGLMVAVSVHMLTTSRSDKSLSYVDVFAFLSGAVVCGVICHLSRSIMSDPVEDDTQEERRTDPHDGWTGTLGEARAKYDGRFSTENELINIFHCQCQPVFPSASKAADERRIDPDDGKPYTLSDIRDKHSDYGEQESLVYFREKCRPAPPPSRLGSIMLVTLCAHNVPEGAAVAIAASLTEPTLGIALMLAVALHNIPEGAGLSIALYRETMDWWQSFNKTVFCGFMELFGAFLALVFIQANQGTPAGLILTLTAVAGVMCYVALVEILPEVVETGEWFAIAAGFLLSFGCYMGTMEVMKRYLNDGRMAAHLHGPESPDRFWFI